MNTAHFIVHKLTVIRNRFDWRTCPIQINLRSHVPQFSSDQVSICSVNATWSAETGMRDIPTTGTGPNSCTLSGCMGEWAPIYMFKFDAMVVSALSSSLLIPISTIVSASLKKMTYCVWKLTKTLLLCHSSIHIVTFQFLQENSPLHPT